MSYKINDAVEWVGIKDWDLRTFHGWEYSTHRGTSYNAYLIRDEKVALIDTVWRPYAAKFVANLKKEIDLDEIDYIIVNHGEEDHSGALPELMREIPDKPIYCTKNCVRSLKGLEPCRGKDRGQAQPGRERPYLYRSPHASLAGLHVHLHDPGQHPLQQ